MAITGLSLHQFLEAHRGLVFPVDHDRKVIINDGKPLRQLDEVIKNYRHKNWHAAVYMLAAYPYFSFYHVENPDGTEPEPARQSAQGLVEYALILVLIALVVIAILTILGPTIGNVFSNIVEVL